MAQEMRIKELRLSSQKLQAAIYCKTTFCLAEKWKATFFKRPMITGLQIHNSQNQTKTQKILNEMWSNLKSEIICLQQNHSLGQIYCVCRP